MSDSNHYFEGYKDGIVEARAWFISAREIALWHGHDMTAFLQVGAKLWFDSTCIRCGKEVRVNMKPAPNETNVSGPAVAVNCDA